MGLVKSTLQHWFRSLHKRTQPQASTPRLPDFFCIGAQKAGTSWLYHELLRHPDVRMPPKELRWFEDHKTSWEDYLSNFRDAGTHVTGDITPVYMVCPTAPEEMKRRCPDARVFAILREPTARAFSQYRMLRWKKRIPEGMSFLEAFWEDSVLVRTRGHYAEHLANYLQYYQLGQDLQVYLHDDVKRDPVAFLHRLDRYLGIREFASPQAAEQYLHPGYSFDGLTITPEDQAVVQQYYRMHNEKLSHLLKRRLTWNDSHSERAAA